MSLPPIPSVLSFWFYDIFSNFMSVSLYVLVYVCVTVHVCKYMSEMCFSLQGMIKIILIHSSSVHRSSRLHTVLTERDPGVVCMNPFISVSTTSPSSPPPIPPSDQAPVHCPDSAPLAETPNHSLRFETNTDLECLRAFAHPQVIHLPGSTKYILVCNH